MDIFWLSFLRGCLKELYCMMSSWKIMFGPKGETQAHPDRQCRNEPVHCPVSWPTNLLIGLKPCCAVSSCPCSSPPAPSIVRRGWMWDSLETGLAAEADRNWLGMPQTINFSMHVFFCLSIYSKYNTAPLFDSEHNTFLVIWLSL